MINRSDAVETIVAYNDIDDDIPLGQARKKQEVYDALVAQLDEDAINYLLKSLKYTKGMEYDFVEITNRDELTTDFLGGIEVSFFAVSHDMIPSRHDPYCVHKDTVAYRDIINAWEFNK